MNNNDWPLLRGAAWVAFALSAFALFMAFSQNYLLFFSAAAQAGFVGIILLAADRALTMLTQIRDALAPQYATQMEQEAPQPATPSAPPRSVAELAADLERLKAKS